MGTVKTTTNSDGSTTTSKLRFSYDANGKVVAVNYNGNYYYYLRNAQSDIVKLIDKTGATVVEYTYDSWGKLLSTSGSLASTLGKNNPFRYRGYVYDEETGFYYLQSRYYNPEVGRFISADVLLSTGQGVLGHNAYAYCLNNPVNGIDPDGYESIFIDPSKQGVFTGFGASTGERSSASVDRIGSLIIAFLTSLLTSANVEIDADADVKAEEESINSIIYYGAIIENGSLSIITVPMSMEEAVIWANTTAELRRIVVNGGLETLGKDRNWGIYTHSYTDAYEIAKILGGGVPVGPEVGLQTGCYWHFHVKGRDFHSRYKHFHIWYG